MSEVKNSIKDNSMFYIIGGSVVVVLSLIAFLFVVVIKI